MQTRTQKVKEYFKETDNYIKNNLVIVLRTILIKRNLPDLKNKSILDIGCGNGELSIPYISKNKISFLDLSDNMLNLVRKQIATEYLVNATFIKQDILKFIHTEVYDYLFILGVLAHTESIDMTFLKLVELMNDEGILIMQYTNSQNFISLILRVIGKLKSISGGKYGYKINYTSSKRIRMELEKHKLVIYKKINYWPALPGFKLIPNKLRRYIYFNLLNSSFLQPVGGEVLLFIKFDKRQ